MPSSPARACRRSTTGSGPPTSASSRTCFGTATSAGRGRAGSESARASAASAPTTWPATSASGRGTPPATAATRSAGRGATRTYLYTGPDALDPLDRSPILGVRCAVYETAPPEAVFGALQPACTATTRRSARSRTTVFAVYRRLFDYDPGDLAAKLESTDDRPEHWRIEKVSFAAAYGGERIPAQLFLPRNAAPPYQTVVYFPPASAHLDPLERGRRDARVRLPRAEAGGPSCFPSTRAPSSAASPRSGGPNACASS